MGKNIKIKVVVDNHAQANLLPEHGLALYIQTPKFNFLFDTGAGKALFHNLKMLHIKLKDIQGVVLSHGHGDHSGALPMLPYMPLWAVRGVAIERYSCHADKPVHKISSPLNVHELYDNFQMHYVSAFTKIAKGVFVTGPIPRMTSEDSGGPFFFDKAGEFPDVIADEQALLLKSGVLISGCCHAGIVNTIVWCHINKPKIKIHTVIGGLHLKHASQSRLEMTADFLNDYGVKKLYLMHCTGDNAVEFLRQTLKKCEVFTPIAGDMHSS